MVSLVELICDNGVGFGRLHYLRSWGDGKKQSSNLAGLFVRLQQCSNRYVACYAPFATPLNTNKNPTQYRTIICFQLP